MISTNHLRLWKFVVNNDHKRNYFPKMLTKLSPFWHKKKSGVDKTIKEGRNHNKAKELIQCNTNYYIYTKNYTLHWIIDYLYYFTMYTTLPKIFEMLWKRSTTVRKSTQNKVCHESLLQIPNDWRHIYGGPVPWKLNITYEIIT